ncbi:hypothetical protein ONZ45_g15861 [Pleurotus djamor]|nr:hypothetical protein ONZ45_g15861 [Pleurotus djamor]
MFEDDVGGFYSGCSIWEVGNLQGNCPTTTFLHSLKFTSLEGGPPFCLTGNYLAWSGLSCIEIYDWKRSSPLCHYKTGFQVAGFPRRIELLPDGRILSFYHDSLAIYALPEFRIIKDEGWVHQSTIQPLRSLRFPDQAYLVSPSYSPLRIERDGACVMLIRPYKSMYKLTIPPVPKSHLHVDSEVTLTFICSDFNRHLNSATFGFYRNLAEPAYKEVRRYTLLRGSVKDCHEPHALGSKDYNISDVQYLYPVFDDISCRSVLAMARQDRFEVLDYAPPP